MIAVKNIYKSFYKKHLRGGHLEKTLLRCDHLGCDYVTTDIKLMKSHVILHSDERPFTCSKEGCGKTFKRKSYLIVHRISHTSKLIHCTREGCEQIFKAEIYLKRHINYKHPSVSKSYVCIACGKYYDTMGKRQHHQRVVHRKIDQLIVCHVNKCNREFQSRYCYRKHTQICHSGQQVRCDHSGCDYFTGKKDFN